MPEGVFNAADYTDTYPPGVERHYWSRWRNQLVYHELQRAALGQGRVLEVGCGAGVVVQALRKRGCNAFGVELGRPALHDPSLQGYVFIGQSAHNLAPDFRAEVKALLLLDVLEHVPDALGFLGELLPAFPAARHLVVTLPARAELWSNYDTRYGHYLRYDLAGLRALFQQAKLKELDVRYVFHLLYAPLWISLKLGLARDTVMHTPHGLRRFAHRLIAATGFFMDTRLWPKNWPGTSLLALVEREPPPNITP